MVDDRRLVVSSRLLVVGMVGLVGKVWSVETALLLLAGGKHGGRMGRSALNDRHTLTLCGEHRLARRASMVPENDRHALTLGGEHRLARRASMVPE